ncbi:hypothetical protein GP486_002343 [Trichoglossum hirsutum]|uniref:G domain-containing protein n=1 Tax=Trichoglossum hirsutum TaxID=265104 RepID=A0A9P8LF90_9PEZI|nr:hypothetical protein GP486_002343 [Trichoglossum hirsutum]
MAPQTTFEVEIVNRSGSGGRKAPGDFWRTGRTGRYNPARFKVLGPIEVGGSRSFTYKKRYFGFIGRLQQESGRQIVKSEIQREATLRPEAANDGACLLARALEGDVLHLELSPVSRLPHGTFSIQCVDPRATPHDFVVGLAHQFDGVLVPVAAVPYSYGVTYTIRPRGPAAPVYVLQQDLNTGQAIPRGVSPGYPIEFRNDQTRLSVAEDSAGNFSTSTSGNVSGGATRGATPGPNLGEARRPIAIAVMGITGAGKSTFIKEVTGNTNIAIGSGVDSTTTEVQVYRTVFDGQEVLLLDTPGFDDTARNEGQILENITGALARIYTSRIPISGVIYLHDISGERLTGSARRYLEMFKKIVGPNAIRNVTLLTTKWDRVSQASYNEGKERDLLSGPWRELVRHHASVRRISLTSGPEAYKSIVRELLQNVATPLQIQQELVDQGLPLNQTSAGLMLDEEIRKATEALRKELTEVHNALQEAQTSHGKEMQELRQSLEEDKGELRKQLDEATQSRNALQQQFDGLRADMLRQLQQQQQQAPQPQPNLANQASSLFHQGLMAQALQLYSQAYQLAFSAFGPYDGRTAEAQHNVQTLQGSYVGSFLDKGQGGRYYDAGQGNNDDDDNDDDSDDSY